MTAPTYVVLPILDEPDLTRDVLALLRGEEFEACLVFDNGSKLPETKEVLGHATELDPRVRVIEFKGGIYAAWNLGWDMAIACARYTHGGPTSNVCFINNDVSFDRQTIEILADALRTGDEWWAVYPDYRRRVSEGLALEWQSTGDTLSFLNTPTHGTYRDGGLCGWMFMTRGEKRAEGLPRIDEQFEWFCGDDDLVWSIEALGGKVGRVDGLPLDHIGEATARHHDWTHDAKVRDLARFEAKWGARSA